MSVERLFAALLLLEAIWIVAICGTTVSLDVMACGIAVCSSALIVKAIVRAWASKAIDDAATREKLAIRSFFLLMRLGFVAAEVYILFVDPGWFKAFDLNALWTPFPAPLAWTTSRFYRIQLGGWLFTAMNQFFLPPDKDQVNMFVHHIATVFLVAGSLCVGAHRGGVVVLFIHDLSDLPADAVKIAHYLDLTGPRHCFLTEALFVSTMVAWAVCRLWAFPRVIFSVLVDARRFLDGGAGRLASGEWSLLKSFAASPFAVDGMPGWLIMSAALVVLFMLHCWWYTLFVRIAVRLVTGDSAQNAGQAEYSSADAQDEKKTKVVAGSNRVCSALSVVVRMAVATLLSVLVVFGIGLLVTPPILDAYSARFGADDDVIARRAAVKGLTLDGGDIPPISTVFTLSSNREEQEVQRAFLRYYGFAHFSTALSSSEVQHFLAEKERVEQDLLRRNATQVNGVPLFRGTCADGTRLGCLHRIPFGSLASADIKDLIHDARFNPIKALLDDPFWRSSQNDGGATANATTCDGGDTMLEESRGSGVRIGDREKDGVVLNTYVAQADDNAKKFWSRTKLGWHTDGLRDIFYGRMPMPMLNVGFHLDTVDVTQGDAALCLIPRTHTQSFASFIFRKLYFLQHDSDADEVCVATTAGDVTIHDGRLWHRVQGSTKTGVASVRRSAYVPFLTAEQPVEIKSQQSHTPIYHYLGMALRRLKGGA